MKLLVCLLVLLAFPSNLQAVEKFSSDAVVTEVENRPLDVVLGKLITEYYEYYSSFDLKSGDSLEKKKEKELIYQSSVERVFQHTYDEQLILKVAEFFKNTDDMNRNALRGLVKRLIVAENLRAQEGSSVLSESGVDGAAALFEGLDRASYEYAYGNEIGREVVDTFEAIHRSTFMENLEHKVDIDIDFLKPIKKVVEKLNLKEKFKWLWNQKLHWGYHSHFIHKKKVFMRSHGYYQKVAVKLQVLRRERYWWGGTGDWEVHGSSTKMMEEPRALVATEARELD
jgi:hypothetical protein